MDIVNPRLSASQSGDQFSFFVEYTATFHPQEAHFVFEDSIEFAERDAGEEFDHLFNEPIEVIEPNGQTSVLRRRERHGVSGGELSTELGNEEVVAFIHLRNRTLNGQSLIKRTPLIELSD